MIQPMKKKCCSATTVTEAIISIVLDCGKFRRVGGIVLPVLVVDPAAPKILVGLKATNNGFMRYAVLYK